jgi:hypothetical protein
MKNSPHLRQFKVWGKGKPSIIKEKTAYLSGFAAAPD